MEVGSTAARLFIKSTCQYYIGESGGCKAGDLCIFEASIAEMEIPPDMTNLPGDPVSQALVEKINMMILECYSEFYNALNSTG